MIGINQIIGASDKKHLISIGRLDDQKQFDLLIRVFANIAPIYQNWSLTIAGEGPLRHDLEQLVLSLGLVDRIKFPGRITNIGNELANADIFVLTSKYEGFPNALLEAMLLGLPCVAFDCPSGPREITMDGEVGLLVRLNDENGLQNALMQLMSSADFRQKLGSKARASVIDRFSLDKILMQWDELFKLVCVK
jgi:glycosyltransferase involved in cell wall biosynthesis